MRRCVGRAPGERGDAHRWRSEAVTAGTVGRTYVASSGDVASSTVIRAMGIRAIYHARVSSDRYLSAVLELRGRAWDVATGEVLTDRTNEVRRQIGERLEVELEPAPLGFVLRAVSSARISLAADAELPVAVSPATAVDPTGRVLELAIGDRVRLAAPDRGSTCELRLVAIRSVDARTMPGSSPLERDLLAAIRAAPEDEPPRLIYADWLLAQQAQSDRDRGELLQLQCALATALPPERRRAIRARERELIAAQPPPSFGERARLELVWSRGFLERCRGGLADLARNAVDVFQLAPMLTTLELEVEGYPDRSLLHRLATLEPLDQIRELTLAPRAGANVFGAIGDELLVALVPALASLRRLRVTALRVGERGVASLVGGRGCAQLAMLDLTGNALGPDAVQALAGSAQLQPAVLRLASCALAGGSIEALAKAPWLAELEELDLCGDPLRDPGARALARVPFSRLRRLALASCGIGKDGGRALLRSPHLARLRQLRLHENAIGDAGAIAIARSRMRSIEDLDLQTCAIGDAGVIELAGSPNVRAARRWRLGGNPIGDAGARAIAASDHTRGLTSLDLARCRIGDAGALALAAHASAALELGLAQNPIGDPGAAALVDSPARAVTLSAAPLSTPMRDRVRDRFGDDALSARPPSS